MVVPAGTWFGAVLSDGGVFGLMGTTMAPGYDPEDFTLGVCEELTAGWPEAQAEILRLV
jgi:predicted cupin superfamily sugar epimerase